MGVIFLALISYGEASSTDTIPPLWVIVSCAVAIALGTYLGGWRVIRTTSKGLVEIESPQRLDRRNGLLADSDTFGTRPSVSADPHRGRRLLRWRRAAWVSIYQWTTRQWRILH